MRKFKPEFYNDEPRELIVSGKTKKLWAVILDLLLEFDEVCRRREIKYCLEAGTLLGAVRHKGFIPWDDDIDVIMTRSEYKKLCACASEEFKHPYFFQNNDTDPGSMRGHAQLRNSETTGILKSEMQNGVPCFTFNQGIFIDIFILDKIPNDDAEYEKFAAELNAAKARPFAIRTWKDFGRSFLRGKMFLDFWSTLLKGRIRFDSLNWVWAFKGIWYLVKDSFLKRDSIREAYDRFESLAQRFDSDPAATRCWKISFQPLCVPTKRFDISMFEDLCDVAFEGYSFPAPKNLDGYLKCFYGNWHEHVVGGSAHGGLIVDTEKSYTEYFKK